MSKPAQKLLDGLSRGQRIGLAAALYLCVKPVFNKLVLGGSLAPLALGLIAAACLYFGLKRSNLVLAALLMLVACANMPVNLKNIGLNMYLIYALEGGLDMLTALLLAFHPDIRSHCKNTAR